LGRAKANGNTAGVPYNKQRLIDLDFADGIAVMGKSKKIQHPIEQSGNISFKQ